ncbi:MAG: hypothetical protein AAF957_13085 [Planctomycetota bacterium]
MSDQSPDTLVPQVPSTGAPPGSDLRARVEILGTELADRLGVVIDGLPGRPSGPQRLGDALGQTIVTASRLLKAISQTDPIAVVQLLPGPNPLRKTVQAARESGAASADCDAALESIGRFEALIRDEAGDRGSLKAMLTAWLPDERREFEAQRRQSMFKGLAELEGVSCDLEVDALLVRPSGDGPDSAKDGAPLDIVNLKCLLGIDRIRPDAVVKLGTRRLGDDSADARPRLPLNLDGEPALDGLNTARLDSFCTARPAPFLVREFGDSVQYTLGPTGFGRGSKVDLVMGELNRNEITQRPPNAEAPPYFFAIPEMATRKIVFDLILHRDVYAGAAPELITYETAGMGPARPGDPAREVDRRSCPEPLQSLGEGTRRLRILEFARYGALLEHTFSTLGWDATAFRAYRVSIAYPLVGRQLTLAFTRESGADVTSA